MMSLTTIVRSAIFCVLISQIIHTTPCKESPLPCEPPPCEPPPPPLCEPPPPPPCEPPPPPPPCEPPPPPPCEPPPPPPCEPPPPPPCEPPSPPPCEGNEWNTNIHAKVDITVYSETFTECPYVDNTLERDVYLLWIESYSQEELAYIDAIVKLLTIQTSLTQDFKNYLVFKEKIFALYKDFKGKNIYSKEVDLSSQTVVFEEARARVVELIGYVSEQSALYTSLQYCETKVILMPIVVGLCRSVVLSQETYFSQSSTETIIQ